MRLTLLFTLGLILAPAVAADRPNVIVILADDMGVGDVSHHGGKAPTPHLDRLAAEGMRFTDGHSSSSVCTPTRYALLTGRYNWRSPLKKGVLYPPSEALIRHGEPTLAEFLGPLGYRSTVIGKWHLGLSWAELSDKAAAEEGPTRGRGWNIDFSRKVTRGPTTIGFDEDFLFPASLDMAPYVYLRDDVAIDQPTISATFWSNRWGPAVKGMKPQQCLGDFAREARTFIRKNAEHPFFIYLPLTSPHTPIAPSERFLGKSGIGTYGDFLMETDWVVGEVLAELEAQGVADDTLLFFTTDNGCSPQAKFAELAKHDHHPSGPFRGHKADIFEGGHRVPFLVRWPGKVAAGRTSDRTLCQTDIFATVAEALGKELGPEAAPDSFSFLPTLLGRSQEARPSTVHHSINGSFAIRQGPWKLCLCPGSGGWSSPKPKQAARNAELPKVQLYHLGRDPGETTNLEAEHPEKVDALAAALGDLIARGRSTPGPKLKNHGEIPFPEPILQRFPTLTP
jgi:arylsulfatase A-like enzyme